MLPWHGCMVVHLQSVPHSDMEKRMSYLHSAALPKWGFLIKVRSIASCSLGIFLQSFMTWLKKTVPYLSFMCIKPCFLSVASGNHCVFLLQLLWSPASMNHGMLFRPTRSSLSRNWLLRIESQSWKAAWNSESRSVLTWHSWLSVLLSPEQLWM